ncbi:MAG: ABC transporter permease subunit [Butyrivibrio sp.]|nr:ABC transporter permease subunit [Butyrivibrio sp.]
MKTIIFSVRKDLKEILRGKKNVYFSLTLVAIGAMVLLTTLFFPDLIGALGEKAPDMISDSRSLDEMMRNLFPNNVKGSLGVWASDVGVFYTVVITLMTHGLVPEEIKNGRWIMPLSVGYSRKEMLLSKCIVYAASASFPVLILTNAYYMVASFLLEGEDFSHFPTIQSLSLSLAIAGIVIITVLLSTIYNHSITAVITMIGVVLVAPDVLSFFKFGKYLPTYLLTFAYTMSAEVTDLIVPIIGLVALCLILFYMSARKLMKIEVSR